jgi:hypothetical protein
MLLALKLDDLAAAADRSDHAVDLAILLVNDRVAGAERRTLDGALPVPDDESAVPAELVPGASAECPRPRLSHLHSWKPNDASHPCRRG